MQITPLKIGNVTVANNVFFAPLAEKLGYHFDHEYTTYEIYNY